MAPARAISRALQDPISRIACRGADINFQQDLTDRLKVFVNVVIADKRTSTNDRQIVLAAEISVDGPDFGQLEPMVEAATRELDTAGVSEAPEVVVADAGYWHHEQMDELAGDGIQVLIPPDSGKRKGTRPGWQGGRYAWMRRVLATELGERLYRKRSQTVEPMFGHTKHNRGMDRFHRRGRSAVRTEWRLITATHNLMKLHSHQLAAAAA